MSAESLANAQYVAAANTFLTMARVLADSKDDLEWVLETIAKAHALMPVLDPTAYRSQQQNLTDQAELFRPLLDAARQLAPILESHRHSARL